MKKLLLGDEAIAQGALDAGLSGVYAYPGTPSTEITEYIQNSQLAKDRNVHRRWATNEKTAMEQALGMSYMGKRALVCMKHVGLNVAADPFVNSAITGANGGIVILVADDPSMHSSQDEQDTRFYGKFAMIPTFEPSNQQEAYDMMAVAYDYSEKMHLPVLMRVTTRMAHSRAVVNITETPREQNPLNYEAKASDWVLLPAFARKRNVVVTGQQAQLEQDAVESPFNKYIDGKDHSLGIITSGIAFNYLNECYPDGVPYPVLKVSQYPLPKELVRRMTAECDSVLIVEEGQPFIEEQVRGVMDGNAVIKGRLTGELPRTGELSPDELKQALGLPSGEEYEPCPDLASRPPQFCKGCGHRDVYTALNEVLKEYPNARVFGDIGCYTLGNAMPLDMVDTCLCMGAGIDIAQGIGAVTPGMKCFAFVGDSTFFASSITGIINGVYNQADLTVCILDNSTTAMTGHQPHPGTGHTMMGQIVDKVSIKETLKGIGVKTVRTVDPLDLEAAIKAVKDVASEPGVKAIIFKSPCIAIVKPLGRAEVLQEACRKCKKCIREIGCPGIVVEDGKIMVDASQCTGCGICADICPFDAIEVTSFEKREGSAK